MIARRGLLAGGLGAAAITRPARGPSQAQGALLELGVVNRSTRPRKSTPCGESPIVAWETSAAVWAAGGSGPGLAVDPTEVDPAGAHFVGFGKPRGRA